MNRFRQYLLICVVALESMAAFASSAMATGNVLNPGTFTIASSNTLFRFLSDAVTFPCTSSRIIDNIAATGAGTIPVGSVTYSGCGSAVLGTFTVRQTAAWTDAVSWLLASGRAAGAIMVFTVPTDGVTLHSNALNCDISLGGHMQTDLVAVPGTIRSLNLSAANSLSVALPLAVTSTTCSSSVARVGLAVQFGGTYAVNPGIQAN